MFDNSKRFVTAYAGAAAALTGLALAACTPQYSTPQQVQASNPTVTYKYRSDQELVQANQNAATFCTRYQAVARTASFSNDPDGSKVVVFECVQTSPTPAPQLQPQFNPNLTYSYRTDQELLDASRNAQAYCTNNGAPRMSSNIVANANGTKTITFQCNR